ncbi:hypothetical protein ACSSWA_12375 [Melioribacter sp. Ez-97]|uniref:hypothetical protein n=1 Tax=Melioribacter sp. Ez-97 TaxID=3423434 RepID=UPI003ED87FD2
MDRMDGNYAWNLSGKILTGNCGQEFMIKNIRNTKMHLTPVKAIKKHCFDCSGGSKKEVRECIITDCPLYLYRMGKNPNRKGIKNNGSSNVLEKKTEHSRVNVEAYS